jgi:polygalacturonase
MDGEGRYGLSPAAPWSVGTGRGLPASAEREKALAVFHANVKAMNGLGNKVLALKNSRGVTLRDFSILRAGHFGVLLTGVDNVVMDGLTIDTNRDGIDLDVVRNARLSNLSVNSPYDDAIVLKSTLALGVKRPTENVAITNCNVSGFDVGTLLDGTYKRSQLIPPLKHRTSGRIKLGTESNGGYRNITVSNCVFDCCNGLALESVDGAALEDVTVSNLVMRDVVAAPLFIRLADRRRAPKGTPIASLSRVSISNIDAACVDPRYCATVTGVPGAMAKDITLRGIRFVYPGGGTAADARRKMPEMVTSYPDPDIFGTTSAWGLYMRHVRGIVLEDIEMTALKPDARPAVGMDDVTGLNARDVLAAAGPDAALKAVTL